MTAFFVSSVIVKDPVKFQEYGARAVATMEPFGGAIVKRGLVKSVLAGKADHQAIGIAEFPDLQSLNNWHESDAYQALIPLRDEAADLTIVSYEVPV